MFKKAISAFTNWILYTSIFASLCAVGLCMATERLILQTIPHIFTSLHLFICGSCLVVYNIHYVVKKSSLSISDRYKWTQQNRHWHKILLITGLLLCCSFFWMLSLESLVCCIVLAILSFAYSLPILPLPGKKKLRDFGWIKIIVLSGVWTIVTSILPMIYWDIQLSAFPFEILLRFVLMFILCLAFDIRDMQTDLEADIYTLPNKIGVSNTYLLIDIMTILFVILCILQYFHYPSWQRLIGSILTAIIIKAVIIYSKKHPSDRAYLGLVDGVMLLYALMIVAHR